MSRKKRSRNKIQELRIAAMVKITVSMNHAQTYIASASSNCGLIDPSACVYAAMMPEPGKYIMAYERLKAP